MHKVFCGEKGVITPEWLVLAVAGGILTTIVVAILYPVIQQAHSAIVNRITQLVGSGF
jgi:hypothetical protein